MSTLWMPTPTGLSCAVTILRDHSPHAVGSLDGSCLAQARSHAPPINPAGCFHTLVYFFCSAMPNQNSVTYVNWASDGERLSVGQLSFPVWRHSVENHSPRRHGGHGLLVSLEFSPCLRGESSFLRVAQAHVTLGKCRRIARPRRPVRTRVPSVSSGISRIYRRFGKCGASAGTCSCGQLPAQCVRYRAKKTPPSCRIRCRPCDDGCGDCTAVHNGSRRH